MHDVFACVRLFDLLEHNKENQQAEFVAFVHSYGDKLFGAERWREAVRYYEGKEDKETRAMQMGLSLLDTSGYHDDPRDTKRTQANLESAAINYIQRYPLGRFIPIYNKDFIGVEIPFDVTVSFPDTDLKPIRFVGRIDAVCTDTLRTSDQTPEVHENKTGSRIDTVWSSSFDVSHQVTGYCVAMSCLLSSDIRNVVMWGLQIPVPKASSYTDGVMRYPTSRDGDAFLSWAQWFAHTLHLLHNYKDDPVNAPTYTHSCNRYFRACSFIPFCTEPPAQRQHIFDNEMKEERWSPLDQELV
jgi:hypothetical protein